MTSLRITIILVLMAGAIYGTVRLWWRVYRTAKRETCPDCGRWKRAEWAECTSCYVNGSIEVDEAPGAWDNL